MTDGEQALEPDRALAHGHNPGAAPLAHAVVRVLVVDDGELARRGLRHIIGREGLEVVGAAPADDRAVELARTVTPDVAVVRLGTATQARGLALVSALAGSGEVLVLGHALEAHELVRVIDAGARGYVLSDACADELGASVRIASKGCLLLLPPTAGARIVPRSGGDGEAPGRSTGDDGEAPRRSGAQPGLSRRELEVLRLVVRGKNNTAIANDLFISPSTVKKHVSTILSKLEATNRVDAAVRAARSGLLDR